MTTPEFVPTMTPEQAASDAGFIVTLVLRRTAEQWSDLADAAQARWPNDPLAAVEIRAVADMRRRLNDSHRPEARP